MGITFYCQQRLNWGNSCGANSASSKQGKWPQWKSLKFAPTFAASNLNFALFLVGGMKSGPFIDLVTPQIVPKNSVFHSGGERTENFSQIRTQLTTERLRNLWKQMFLFCHTLNYQNKTLHKLNRWWKYTIDSKQRFYRRI